MKVSNYCKDPESYYYVGLGPLDTHQSLSIDLSPAGRDPAGEEGRRGGYIIINLRSDPRGFAHVSTRDSPSKAARTVTGVLAAQFGTFTSTAVSQFYLTEKHVKCEGLIDTFYFNIPLRRGGEVKNLIQSTI